MQWLIDNSGNVLVGGSVALVALMAYRKIQSDKLSGKACSSCPSKCSACSQASSCPSK